jgi:hypothetical protein
MDLILATGIAINGSPMEDEKNRQVSEIVARACLSARMTWGSAACDDGVANG